MAKPQSTMRSSERAANRAEKTLRLQELLDTWRTRAAMNHAAGTNVGYIAEATYVKCANDLQAVLDA